MEVANDQTSDEAAVDAALEDQSVMTSSESEMLSNDQVISMLVGETTNAVTQFVGDNIDIVKYCLYFPWKQSLLLDGLNQSRLSSTTFARSTDNRSCPQGEVEALGKVKVRQS